MMMMMKLGITVILAFFVTPSFAYAECKGLIDLLHKEYPNRTLLENYGYGYDKFVIFEPSLTEKKSTISVIDCVSGTLKTVKTSSFDTNQIVALYFNEIEARVYVIFVFNPEEAGRIEEQHNGSYTFTYQQ